MILSTALWRPTSSRSDISSPASLKSATPCRPPVLSNTFCAERSVWGRPSTVSALTDGPSATCDAWVSIMSSDALPHTPQLDVE